MRRAFSVPQRRSPGSPDGPVGHPAGESAAARGGTWLVVALLLLGVVAATGAIWFHRRTTRRCLEFYGPAAARRITTAATVQLLLLGPGSGPRRLAEASRLDVSRAPGLVHLRRGLVEDANFVWPDPIAGAERRSDPPPRPTVSPPRPLASWDVALMFSGPETVDATTLVIDLDETDGAVTVVGQPGRITLGRIGRGLRTWIRDALDRAGRDRPGPGGASTAEHPGSAAPSR